MHEVDARQRNTVFPDTTQNEARFWRNMISGKQHLSTAQMVGLLLVCGVLAAPVWDMIKAMSSIVGWLFFGACGAFFLLLRWRVRKALSRTESHSTHASK
jgi:ABC-type uncharacterized transport system permease subunit